MHLGRFMHFSQKVVGVTLNHEVKVIKSQKLEADEAGGRS